MEIVRRESFPCRLTPKGILMHLEREVNRRLPEWRTRVARDPECFGRVEEDVLAWSRGVAGLLTAAVLDDREVQERVDERAEAIRREAPGRQHKGYRRPRHVKLLCGLVLTVLCWYCRPRAKKKTTERPDKGEIGLYPEWAALGIREGASPGLQSEAARMVVLMPSMEAARVELERRGCDLDVKTVRRLALEMGAQALAARKEDLEAWRRGEVAVGQVFAGKRIAVAIDGGRTRTREARKPGKRSKKQHRRSKKQGAGPKRTHRRYQAPWREPKVAVIYVLNKHGAIDGSSLRVVDATLQGPDHLMELVAFHLHRLGAVHAQRVVFLADGTDWIWDRVPKVVKRVGLEKDRCYYALDVCHAVNHIALALEACTEKTPEDRKAQLSRLRRMLKDGRLDEVIAYLEKLKLGRRSAAIKAIEAEIAYLEKRRSLMRYDELVRKKLPIGSGAVESAIRRIINLRVKGAGMFWTPENAEAVIYLRAQALTDRWEEMLERVRKHAMRTRDLEWKWQATPMSFATHETSQLQKQKHVKRCA
jgi:hypothetical protein